MELAIKIFILVLIIFPGIFGCYCMYEIQRIRNKWKKEGLDEDKLREKFYRNLSRDK